MSGVKNVFTGSGTIWLQETPPDNLISEVAWRIPSGGIGIIPIGLMGGGGDSGIYAEYSGCGVWESTIAAEDTSVDNLAASTDQDNSIISSDIMPDGSGSVDGAESPSALFGDAASAPDWSSSRLVVGIHVMWTKWRHFPPKIHHHILTMIRRHLASKPLSVITLIRMKPCFRTTRFQRRTHFNHLIMVSLRAMTKKVVLVDSLDNYGIFQWWYLKYTCTYYQ